VYHTTKTVEIKKTGDITSGTHRHYDNVVQNSITLFLFIFLQFLLFD